MDSLASSHNLRTSAETRGFLHGPITAHFLIKTVETLRSKNGEGNGNVRSLGRAGLRRVGVPAKIEITNFTSENVDDRQIDAYGV